MTSENRVGTNIQITGVKETVAALKAFQPEIAKRLNSEIRKSVGKVKARALSRYPSGSYSLTLNNRKILGSVTASAGGDRSKRWGDSSGGIRAAIFEFAGKNQPGKTPQAQGLIKHLNEKYGQPGRFLWAAWDDVGRGVLRDIESSVKAAERDLQASLDSAGEGF